MVKPIVIGLTGNIATGKSTVSDMLANLGAQTIDADKLVHQLLDNNPAVQSKIEEHFGSVVRKKGGAIDRARLAARVFKNPVALEKLEAIIHPYIEQQVVDDINKSRASVVVIEAIKLLESNLHQLCQSIWVTTCREEQQIHRLVSFRKMSREQAVARIRSQPPQNFKIDRADVVIDTNNRLEDTNRQVENAWRSLERNLLDVSHLLDGVIFRRGAPRDTSALADFFNRADDNQPPMSRSQLMASFGDQGYMLAEKDGKIVATVGWNTENFIACIFNIVLNTNNNQVGRALLESVCQAASELMCEVVFLFYPADTPAQSQDIYLSSGFRQVEQEELIPAWQKAVRASKPEDNQVMIRQLRDKRIMQPL